MALAPEYKVDQTLTEDFDEIVEVWEASVRATHDFLKEEDILFFKPLILNEFLRNVKLFCVRNGASGIAGFLGVSDDKVEMLFIHPNARGKGIGKILMNHAITHLYVRYVGVNEQNRQAVGFYEHMGFKVAGRSEVDGMGKPYPVLSMQLQ